MRLLGLARTRPRLLEPPLCDREEKIVTFPHHIGTRDPILMPAFYRTLYLAAAGVRSQSLRRVFFEPCTCAVHSRDVYVVSLAVTDIFGMDP